MHVIKTPSAEKIAESKVRILTVDNKKRMMKERKEMVLIIKNIIHQNMKRKLKNCNKKVVSYYRTTDSSLIRRKI